MTSIEVRVRRVTVVSRRPFDETVQKLAAAVGRPEMNAFHGALAAAKSIAEVETVVHSAIGPSGFMEFMRFDSGGIVRKEVGDKAPRILRLLIGNPLVMKEMARAVPDAAAYAPVTILVVERADGVHLSYDSMASLLEPYRNPAALAVATELDATIEGLMEAAAR